MWLTHRNNWNNWTNAKSARKQLLKLQKKWQYLGKIYTLRNFTHMHAWDHFSFPPLYNPAITTAECAIIKHLKSSNKDSERPWPWPWFLLFLSADLWTLEAVKLHNSRSALCCASLDDMGLKICNCTGYMGRGRLRLLLLSMVPTTQGHY